MWAQVFIKMDDWTSYAERANFYFDINDVILDAKKRAIVLSTYWALTFRLIRSLVETGKSNSTSYKDLVELVKKHYDRKPLVTMQRHKFSTCIRVLRESEPVIGERRRVSAELLDREGCLSALHLVPGRRTQVAVADQCQGATPRERSSALESSPQLQSRTLTTRP